MYGVNYTLRFLDPSSGPRFFAGWDGGSNYNLTMDSSGASSMLNFSVNNTTKAGLDSTHFNIVDLLQVPSVRGGATSGANLDLSSTSHATKGLITVQDGSFLIVSNNSSYVDSGLAATEGIPLQIGSEGAVGYLGVVTAYDTDPGSVLYLAGGKGTFSTPDYLDDGQSAGTISFEAADDVSPDAYSFASIQAVAGGTQSSSNHGSILNFNVTKNNDAPTDTNYTLQLNGTVPAMISSGMGLILNDSVEPNVGSNGIAIYEAIASVSAVSTFGLKTAQVVATDAALISTHSLKVWINGVEYKLMLVAV